MSENLFNSPRKKFPWSSLHLPRYDNGPECPESLFDAQKLPWEWIVAGILCVFIVAISVAFLSMPAPQPSPSPPPDNITASPVPTATTMATAVATSAKVSGTMTTATITTLMTAPANQSLSVDFTANITAGSAPLTVRFNAISTGSPSRWSWDFGDGGTSGLEDPIHTYENPGNYTITLHAVYNTASVSKEKADYITVTRALLPPIARFTANPVSGTAPLTVRFSDESTGSPVFWFWDFGDGSSSNLENPTYVYGSPGIYTARLIVGNSAGNTIATRVILVDPLVTMA